MYRHTTELVRQEYARRIHRRLPELMLWGKTVKETVMLEVLCKCLVHAYQENVYPTFA